MERPMLFNGDMALAILEDRKTETRRVIKPQPPTPEEFRGSIFGLSRAVADGVAFYHQDAYERLPKHPTKWDLVGSVGVAKNAGFPREWTCPYGGAGDRLWVKETFADCRLWRDISDEWHSESVKIGTGDHIVYAADRDVERREISPWRSALFMPRAMSRLTLEIVSIRAERVQEITEASAIAEGIERTTSVGSGAIRGRAMGWRDYSCEDPTAGLLSPIDSYRTLWDRINAAPKPMYVTGKIDHYVSHPWENAREKREHRGKPWIVIGNPWVWALTFGRVES